MNQSKKLSLFLELGCKPMKDVIFVHKLHKLSVGDVNCQQLRRMFAYLDWAKEGIYVEAIPLRLTEISFETELDKLFEDAIDVKDTVWYSDHETLRDAIMRIYDRDQL